MKQAILHSSTIHVALAALKLQKVLDISWWKLAVNFAVVLIVLWFVFDFVIPKLHR